jgi:hypothetical protein
MGIYTELPTHRKHRIKPELKLLVGVISLLSRNFEENEEIEIENIPRNRKV